MRILLVFSSSELGGAERSLTRMALSSSPCIYQLATLDGEGPWCDWVRSQGQKPLVFGARNQVLHGSLRLSALILLAERTFLIFSNLSEDIVTYLPDCFFSLSKSHDIQFLLFFSATKALLISFVELTNFSLLKLS